MLNVYIYLNIQTYFILLKRSVRTIFRCLMKILRVTYRDNIPYYWDYHRDIYGDIIPINIVGLVDCLDGSLTDRLYASVIKASKTYNVGLEIISPKYAGTLCHWRADDQSRCCIDHYSSWPANHKLALTTGQSGLRIALLQSEARCPPVKPIGNLQMENKNQYHHGHIQRNRFFVSFKIIRNMIVLTIFILNCNQIEFCLVPKNKNCV